MHYTDAKHKPTKTDEQSVDGFVDWYASQLKLNATMLDRPDRHLQGSIDGDYNIGSLRLAVEHSSVDEATDARRLGAMAEIVRRRVPPEVAPRRNYVYTVHLPDQLLNNPRVAEHTATQLEKWLRQNGASVRGDNRLREIRLGTGVAHVSARKTHHGRSKLYIMPTETAAAGSIKRQLKVDIHKTLDRKLPKLGRYEDDAQLLRVLLIENNEVWRGCKFEYAAHVRGYLQRNIELAPDEIWVMELIGGDVDPTLLWCRQLDGTTKRNPFDLSDGRSLGQAEYRRIVEWAMLRAPQTHITAKPLALHAELASMLMSNDYIEHVYGAMLKAQSWL